MLIVPGVHAEVTFYKGLLDKLGLKFDALQMGKYKGAAEPLTRTEHEPGRSARTWKPWSTTVTRPWSA